MAKYKFIKVTQILAGLSVAVVTLQIIDFKKISSTQVVASSDSGPESSTANTANSLPNDLSLPFDDTEEDRDEDQDEEFNDEQMP